MHGWQGRIKPKYSYNRKCLTCITCGFVSNIENDKYDDIKKRYLII